MTRVLKFKPNKHAPTVEDVGSGDDRDSQQTTPVSTRPDESSFTPASNASDSTYGGNTPPASAGTGHESDNGGHDDTGSQRSGGVYQRSYNWPPAASGGNGGDGGQLSRPPSPAGDSRIHSVTTFLGSWNTGCQAQEVKEPTVFNFGDLRVNSGNYRKPQSPQGSGPGVNYPEERRTPTEGAMAVFGPGNTGIQMQINGVDRGAVCGGRKNGSDPAGLKPRVGKKQSLLAMGQKLRGNAEKMRKQWG
ncbi:hypothetical protein QFC21_006998 [Naganishia friedmannii]|uniref:Uncharacterized protein n=1 Tax=Naganishia friedmannii TaxID=89922 RepID=A0ACC2UY58_9TREE|nr:hypothetical protein QFC21_006998 [Naganishia friedmannii]